MTFAEHTRCPKCLEIGKLQWMYGDYYCEPCKQRYSVSTLIQWARAFEQGREFQRKNGDVRQKDADVIPGVRFYIDRMLLEVAYKHESIKDGWWCKGVRENIGLIVYHKNTIKDNLV